MASTDRSTRVDVTQQTEVIDVSRYSFFQLVELLHLRANVDPENALALQSVNEAVRFTSSASLAFPVRDVISLATNQRGQYQLEAAFLGLHGSQSPMPGYYLDALAWEDAQQEDRLTDFLNVFNHRLLTLLHHIWRKYRYYICFKPQGRDDFSQRMYSLVGLGNESIRASLPINHSKMLAYAGLLASPGRAPEVICGLVSHCFDLPDVTLQSWRFRKVMIAESQQNRLGQRVKIAGKKYLDKSVLGDNFSIGSWVPDRSGKFMLCLNNLSRERFLSFLPNGSNYQALVMFVAFIMRDQFAWDLRLGLAEQQVGGMTIGTGQNNLLGWTSFLSEPEPEPNVIICVRE